MAGVAVDPEPVEVTPKPDGAEVIVGAVRAALEKSGHSWLRRVVVTSEGGCVVLRGVVPSYYLKQLALMTVLAVPGVEEVRNELRVGGGR